MLIIAIFITLACGGYVLHSAFPNAAKRIFTKTIKTFRFLSVKVKENLRNKTSIETPPYTSPDWRNGSWRRSKN